jgi:hypothetical protein
MFGVYKQRARSELVVRVAPMALRAAFSNIRAWTILKADMQLAGQVRVAPVLRSAGWGLRLPRRRMQRGARHLLTPLPCCSTVSVQCLRGGLGMWPPRPDIQAHVLAVRAAGGAWPPPPSGWAAEFRRSSLRCSMHASALALMLCDDKLHSFGAPDVLQLVARGVGVVHASEQRFPGTQAETAARLYVEGGVGVNILNNSSSKWEVLLEPWPLLANMSDPINPLLRADRTRCARVRHVRGGDSAVVAVREAAGPGHLRHGWHAPCT